MDPHFCIGTLDFLPGLQASRLRFDVRWTLEAVKVRSGTPPAVIVQVTTDASRLKRDLGMGSFGSPCFLFHFKVNLKNYYENHVNFLYFLPFLNDWHLKPAFKWVIIPGLVRIFHA